MAGGNYIFQGGTNQSNWVSLSANVASTPLFNLFDPHATNFPSRFYRVIEQ